MSVTNEEILGAIRIQDENITEIRREIGKICISMGRMEQWRNDHEKRANGFEKTMDRLRTRINAQGAIMGIGEIIIAAIAILRGGP